MKSNLTGIIGAMAIEIKHLLSVLEGEEKVKRGNITFYRGRIKGKEVVIAQCGVGKVNAGRVTQLMIDFFSPDVIINTGIAGAVASGLEVNDVVIATSLVQHDFDVTTFGYARGYMCTGHDKDKATSYTADPVVSALLERAASEYFTTGKVVRGIIASGDQFISSAEKRHEISEIFSASAAEMEGAAIAQSSELSGVPFAVLRAISDNADGNAAVSYDRFEKEAAMKSAETVTAFLSLLE